MSCNIYVKNHPNKNYLTRAPGSKCFNRQRGPTASTHCSGPRTLQSGSYGGQERSSLPSLIKMTYIRFNRNIENVICYMTQE